MNKDIMIKKFDAMVLRVAKKFTNDVDIQGLIVEQTGDQLLHFYLTAFIVAANCGMIGAFGILPPGLYWIWHEHKQFPNKGSKTFRGKVYDDANLDRLFQFLGLFVGLIVGLSLYSRW